MNKNRTLKTIKTLLWILIFAVSGYGQITIGGQLGNVVYNDVKNTIQYLGAADCRGLVAEIEGVKEVFEFENCKIELRYLAKDTSIFYIKNKAGRIIFDTILLKNLNEGIAYLQIDKQLIREGAIKKSQLRKLKNLKIIHPCPWMYEREILKFNLIVVEKNKSYQFWEITGGQISEDIRHSLSEMKNPKAVFVEAIHVKGPCHLASIDSIVLDVE